MVRVNLKTADIKEIIKRLHNWKAAGLDDITSRGNILKHSFLSKLINKLLNNPEIKPKFLLNQVHEIKKWKHRRP